MKKLVVAIGLIIISVNLSGQFYSTLKNEITNIDTIKNAKSLFFYGLDFSLLKFTNPKEALNDEVFRKYLGAWLSYYQKELPPRERIIKWLGFRNTVFDEYSVQSRIDSVVKDWVVNVAPEVKVSDISSVIKRYQLDQSDGLGFVVHPVEFNSIDERAKCYFTFFDISTREILWITEIRTYASGLGYTEPFGSGIIRCTRGYIDGVYKKKIKR